MTNYYLDISEDLASDLQQLESSEIVEALSDLVEEQEQKDSDELSQYQSLAELRSDQSISKAERKRRELKWQRTVSTRNRH